MREALERVLAGHMPYPAVVVDRRGDLLAANDAFHAVVAGGPLEAPVNVPRLLLRDLAPRIVNFGEWAWHVVDRLRESALRDPDERLDALVERARRRSPVSGRAPRTWASPSRCGCAAASTSCTCSRRSRTSEPRSTSPLDDLRLEAFLPADAATAELLGSLASRA